MLLTNDVTLITFVPFTLLVFRAAGEGSRALRLTVLETVAANLGSMATPIGNPQNIYLTSVSAMAMRDFAAAVLPYAGLSLLMFIAAVMAEKDEPLRGTPSPDWRGSSGGASSGGSCRMSDCWRSRSSWCSA